MKNFTIDAVSRRSESASCKKGEVSVTVFGYGLHSVLPLILDIVRACGSCALSVAVSEIAVTVSVPKSDGDAVMSALAALITPTVRGEKSR